MEKTAKKTDQKPLGVFDVLSGGFELIWLNPWILLIPIALDLFLWLGPQLNAQPIFQQMITVLALSVPANAPAETTQNIELLQKILQTASESVNVLGVLAAGMPSVIGLQPPAAENARAQFVIGDPFALSGVVIVLGFGAALMTSGYLEMTARPVRNETDARTFVARWLRSCVDLILLAILIVVGLSVLMIPVTLIAGIFSLASQGLGSFLMLGGMMLMFWAMLYLVFAVPAIFVSRANAPQALLNSVSIFRFDFWSAIGLVFIVYLVRAGFGIVWQFFDTNTWGVVFDVIANAFLSSALIAAEMIFYNNRMYWLTVAREKKSAVGSRQ
ncbi:MAG: hypothetical protein L0Y55_05965 [Anaerolineales bacterium]|nr:hypothetical protein [Anaerolineales bacterium]